MGIVSGMKKILFAIVAVICLTIPVSSFAFQGESVGCAGDCTACHSLTKKEAGTLLKAAEVGARIVDVRMSPVKGLWEVEFLRKDKKKGLVYMDFAKQFLVEARFTRIASIGDIPKLKKIDLSRIPLEDAIVMGPEKAKNKIIVFADPECPACGALHKDMKEILKKRKDVVFFIKLFPLPIHPAAYDKARAIQCEKSLALLSDAFEGKKLPAPSCKARAIDDNIALAGALGIAITPAIILPDGRLIPGYVSSDTLLKILDTPAK